MDVKDLQIGDWVNFLVDIVGGETEYDPQTEEYQPMRVNTIASWEVDGEVTSELDSTCSPEQLQPIPLTVKILEENGYAHNIFGYNTTKIEQWVSEDGRITITDGSVIANSNNGWSVHVDNEDMQTIGYFEVTYVHELQHALRLCNINKEIEL